MDTFMMGAQKCTVLGPTGELKNLEKAVSSLAASCATCSAVDWYRRWPAERRFWRRGWRRAWVARRPKRAVDILGGAAGGSCRAEGGEMGGRVLVHVGGERY